MKTEELITFLAAGVEAVDTARARRRYVLALAGGLLPALAFTIGILHLNRALLHELSEPSFWAREAYCAVLSVLGLFAVHRLARPGVRLGLVPAAMAVPVIAMWVLAAVALQSASPQSRMKLILGGTAAVCPFLIALIAAPLFIAFLSILRSLAPTQLRLAGAAAGFAAGSMGALVYSLHCAELAAPFIGVWYLLGMLIPTALGAWLGPRLLRW